MFRTTSLVHALAAVLTLGAFALPSPARADGSASDDKIVVSVAGLRSNKGSVRCSLYDKGDDFPVSQKHVIARSKSAPANKTGTCTFARPARGQKYAVVIHHDENDDGVFQLGALGIPLEGYGFSNNARPVLSAPSFEACQFVFGGGQSALNVTARY